MEIGHKKEINDISDYNSVSDSIQYKDQVNSYSFTPELDGTHRFEFSNVPNGTDLKLTLLNSGWEKLASGSSKSVEVSLSKDETYIIQVTPKEGSVGSYRLTVE